jgi:uncharacterized protein YidB (DUF937 family)
MRDLRGALAESWAEGLASLAGLESEAFLQRRVHLLRDAVDRMTPDPALEMATKLARPHHG